MKKMWLKLVSFVMSFVMTITFMPRSMINAVADGVENAGSASEESASAAVGVTEINTDNRTDSYISKELTEKRTEDSKRFLLDDGMIMEQRFAVPVHYLDGENYKEIDNTLEAKTSADGETYYANKANSFTVRLSENMTKNQAVSIEKDGYVIDFIVNDKPNEAVRVSKAVLPAETAINSAATSAANSSANTDTNSVAKIAGTDTVDYNAIRTTEPVQPRTDESVLTYKKVFSGVDFEYSVDSCGLKENIIINRRLSDYVFTFTLATKGLRLTLGAGGEITAYNEDDEAKFVIPAPNMTDADGVYSEDVYYRLAEIDDDKYALGIVASEEWFADPSRAFPVKIDPAVSAGEKKTANGLTLYYESPTREYNQSRIKFGKIDSKSCDSFMSFPNENNQFYLVGHQLAFSKLKYYVRSVGGNAAGTTEYKVKTARSSVPLSAVTTFSQMNYSNSPVLLSGSIKSTKVLLPDATHEARWEEAYFNPEAFADCPDMVFMWYYDSTSDNQHGEVDVRSGNLPSVLNYYVPTVGIKDDLPYEQVKYNGGGAAVNLVSGALTATFNALSIDVAENPISLQLVYNDGYDDIMTEFGMHKMFGKDVKLNFQQALRIDGRSVRYIDEDGSIDTLGQTLGTYYSVGKSMTYTTDGHSLYIGTRTNVIFSGTKLYRYYDASDIYAEKLMYEVFYSGNKITQIAGYTNGNKTHYVSFTYNGDDRVSSARSYVSEYVGGGNFSLLARCDFVYNSDGRLVEIINGNSDNVKFTLNYENNLLRGLTDFDGYGYIFNRASSTSRVSLVNTTYGESISSGNYFSNFDGYTRYWLRSNNSATLEYYVNGKYEGDRNVTRSFGKEFRSEWTVDDQEEETIISTSVADMTGATDRSYLTYTMSDYVTKEKDNTSLVDEAALAAGNSLDGTISENHGVVSKTGRQYCLSLKISSWGSTFVEVYVAGTKRGTIGISDTTVAYYISP